MNMTYRKVLFFLFPYKREEKFILEKLISTMNEKYM